MALHENLKDARNRMGLSQESVAEQLGISRQAVTKWELGQSKPSAKNLKALAEFYQIPSEELLTDSKKEGPNLILRTNLTKWAIILQAGFLCGCTQHAYMLRKNPSDGVYRGGFIFSLVLLLLCSIWMTANHSYEPDKGQRKKNINMELGYCAIQILIALFTMYSGIGLVGVAFTILVLLVYILYINPKFMNRKFTR